MTKRSTAPARTLAVLALIGGFIVLVVIISAALSGGDSNDGRQGGSPGNVSRQTTPEEKKVPKVYVIENEDTLTAIAHKTGIPVATIERLNPQVDPLSLIAGEKLKLR
jgi:LysM repeat protein